MGGFAKVLVLDHSAADLEDVVADDAFERALLVMDLESGAVGSEGGGLLRVVTSPQVTDEGLAVSGGDPEVGGASVKEDEEGLWGCAEVNFAKVLSVEVIV